LAIIKTNREKRRGAGFEGGITTTTTILMMAIKEFANKCLMAIIMIKNNPNPNKRKTQSYPNNDPTQ
jgi:hypothetical protein